MLLPVRPSIRPLAICRPPRLTMPPVRVLFHRVVYVRTELPLPDHSAGRTMTSCALANTRGSRHERLEVEHVVYTVSRGDRLDKA